MTQHLEPTGTHKGKRPAIGHVRATALALAKERGAAGMTSECVRAAAKAQTLAEVGTVLYKSTCRRELFAARVDRQQRWFATAKLAAAWGNAAQPAMKLGQSPSVKRPAAVPAPVTLAPSVRTGEPIITERTRITRDTRQWPTARWQMRQEAPDERWPRFGASRPGINPDTGRPWGAAA